MRLILDVQTLQSRSGFARGIPRYVTQHCRELLKIPTLVHSLCLNPNRPFPKHLDAELLYSAPLAWGGAQVLRSALEEGPVAYWIMSPFEDEAAFGALLPAPVAAGNVPIVVTLYDLIPLLFPEEYLETASKRMTYGRSLDLLKMADLVLCISERTRTDAIERLGLKPEKTRVIGAGVSPFFNPADDRERDANRLGTCLPRLTPPYLFTVLGDDPRKNLDGLLEAYLRLPAELRARYSLAIGGNYAPPVVAALTARNGSRRMQGVTFTGHVNDECLRALYRNCALFVFPSKYEGFGLPLAEARACGAQAVASRLSPMREVLRDERGLFDPESAGDMAAVIERALGDGDPAPPPAVFPWEDVAYRSVEALRVIDRKPVRRKRRPAIALAGPFPPQRSGIADYNLRLVRELARLADVYVFHAGECAAALVRELGVIACQPVSNLGKLFAPQYLDAAIYSLGNSHHHVETLDKLLQFPGLVWLHDVHLLDLYNTRHNARVQRAGAERLIDSARRMYGGRLPPNEGAFEPFDGQALQHWGLHMTAEMVQASRGLILSSGHALRMLQLDLGPLARMPPALDYSAGVA